MLFQLEDIHSYSLDDCIFFLQYFELTDNEKLAIAIRLGELLEHFDIDDSASAENLCDELLFDREEPCAHLADEWNRESRGEQPGTSGMLPSGVRHENHPNGEGKFFASFMFLHVV